MEASVGASRQDGFHRIAGVDDFLPLPVAGASCLVTSASFGVDLPAGKAWSGCANLRILN
jgi:hypothetical protein